MAAPVGNAARGPYMSEDARTAKNKYMREWRKRNPEKDKAIKERYWRKKAALDKAAV